MKWITAAAAAGTLSSASPSEAATTRVPTAEASGPQVVVSPERARILEIAREVRRLVVRFTDADARAVIAPRALQDLGIDDVALADLTLGLESRFDIDIDDAEAGKWQTVGDVVGLVAQRMREAHAPSAAD